MTVCEATEELLKYYKDNDVFVLSKDVSKVLLISEDEDAELQQMLTGQLQTLSTAYQAELARFMKGGQ